MSLTYGVRISALFAQSISNNWCIVAGSMDDGVIRAYSLGQMKFVTNVTVSASPVTSLIMIPSLYVISGHSDGSVYALNPFTNAYSGVTTHTMPVSGLLVLSNSSFLSGSKDNTSIKWNVSSNGNLTAVTSASIFNAAFTAFTLLSNSTFLSAQIPNTASLWAYGGTPTPYLNLTVAGTSVITSLVANYYFKGRSNTNLFH
jgi:WD40 repeat protein